MNLLIATFTIGFILSLLALGVFISFRIFAFPDITADGSVTLGAAVAATLLVRGVSPPLASLLGFLAGMLAGACTGTLHTRFNINPLLSGILVMTALYSVNLHIMGRSNVALLSVPTLATQSERIGMALARGTSTFGLAGWEVSVRDASTLAAVIVAVGLTGSLLYWFFRTNIGMAMRATGDNVTMIRALGVNDANMIIFGLAISNGFVALAGALLAQYQGFADVGMGIGMVVWGLASVIIGEALVGSSQLAMTIVGAVMGSVLFRLLVAVALRWGLSPNDLKLITAVFVFFALVTPGFLRKRRGARA